MSNKNLCNNCNCKSTKTFELSGRGYGSKFFDGLDFVIELCDNCIKELNVVDEWFDNDINAVEDLFIFDYKNEDKIVKLISSLPLSSQEKILNKPTPCCAFEMDTEEWMKLYPNGFFN